MVQCLQVFGIEFEIDQEQQQYYVEFGEFEDVFDFGDEVQFLWVDDDVGQQVVQYGIQFQMFGDGYGGYCCQQVDEGDQQLFIYGGVWLVGQLKGEGVVMCEDW